MDDVAQPGGFNYLIAEFMTDVMTDLEITPAQFAAMRRAGSPYRLIDVREEYEVAIAKIEGSEDIPMRQIPGALAKLEDDDRPLVVMCHHGVRSLQVVCWLREHGVENCRSLAGGIEQWSRDIDPEVARY